MWQLESREVIFQKKLCRDTFCESENNRSGTENCDYSNSAPKIVLAEALSLRGYFHLSTPGYCAKRIDLRRTD